MKEVVVQLYVSRDISNVTLYIRYTINSHNEYIIDIEVITV